MNIGAMQLDAHPYFNVNPIDSNKPTTVKMLPPSFVSAPSTVRISFEINDPDGLHQAQLQARSDIHGDIQLLDCKSLSGESSLVEFVTTTTDIHLAVMDANGNYRHHQFSIDISDLIAVPSKVISIPDANLQREIRGTLGLSPDVDITTHAMLKLRSLMAYNKQISNLTGLEHALNLTWIDLRESRISDISPLVELTQLKTLQLWNAPISDISPLAELTQLQRLELGYATISDISLLAGLTKLQYLDLRGNPITDISPLVELTQLKTLQLWVATISDISPLAELTQLQRLELGHTTISDISPLTELTKLQYLDLRGNRISDLSPLVGLTELRDLWASENQIINIMPLTALIRLEHLYLSSNQISDVSPLKGLVNLQKLTLQGNPIKDRKPLLELLGKNPDVKIYLKSGDEPLPVNLSHFRAEHTDAGVILKWITESEVDNAGFYIYRSQTRDGEFKIVTHQLIQGAGTTAERHTYTWTDTTAKPNVVYYYRIEDISHAGVRKQLATVRMRGVVSASGKLTTRWADFKAQE